MNKKLFSTSPYRVGSSRSNSLAVVIPAQIVKDQKIDTSTIFLVKSEADRIIIEKVNFLEEKMIDADKSLDASSQHISTTQIP